MLRVAFAIAAVSVSVVTVFDDLRPAVPAQNVVSMERGVHGMRPEGIPLCSDSDRERRRVTCIVDGDTDWMDGVKWRLVARSGGVDAPELGKPECLAEAAKASGARDRLGSLMSGGYAVERGGEDGHGRALVRITLPDGTDAGDALIAGVLAKEWPNRGNVWCGR